MGLQRNAGSWLGAEVAQHASSTSPGRALAALRAALAAAWRALHQAPSRRGGRHARHGNGVANLPNSTDKYASARMMRVRARARVSVPSCGCTRVWLGAGKHAPADGNSSQGKQH